MVEIKKTQKKPGYQAAVTEHVVEAIKDGPSGNLALPKRRLPNDTRNAAISAMATICAPTDPALRQEALNALRANRQSQKKAITDTLEAKRSIRRWSSKE